MKYLMILISLVLFSQNSMAAGNGPVTVDWGFISLQVINFVVFISIIGFLCNKFLPNIMSNFKEDYLAKASEAKAKFEEAKRTKEDLQRKLLELEQNYDETLKKAKSEAQDLKLSKVQKAEKQAGMMDKDLDEQIIALKRAYWLEVKTSLINQAVSELKDEFSTKIDPAVLKKLQDDFVSKINARVS